MALETQDGIDLIELEDALYNEIVPAMIRLNRSIKIVRDMIAEAETVETIRAAIGRLRELRDEQGRINARLCQLLDRPQP
ncbi:MAG: hypothetical protein ACTHLA_06500 [Asticcacaulis sp.]|uniref:hypothetical protein n=1 Tax=Asticcacaulis sp. TaxID=1872648 RepID=UPI003F7BE27D